MNLNGLSPFVMSGAWLAPCDAIVPVATLKASARLLLSHLIIWVGTEQRARE
jgi:hypothetical protein